jgi:hypothetical protein
MSTVVVLTNKSVIPSDKILGWSEDLSEKTRKLMILVDLLLENKEVLEVLRNLDEKRGFVFSREKSQLKSLLRVGVIKRKWRFFYALDRRRRNEIVDLVLTKHKRNLRADLLLIRALKNENNRRVLSKLVEGHSPAGVCKILRMESGDVHRCCMKLGRVGLINYSKEHGTCSFAGKLISKLLE